MKKQMRYLFLASQKNTSTNFRKLSIFLFPSDPKDEYLSKVSIEDNQPLFQSVNKAGIFPVYLQRYV